jgi:iron complex outermembrane recepter protein
LDLSRAVLICAASFAALGVGPALAAEATVGEVVVTAAPYAVSLDSATTNIDILKRDDLEAAVSSGLGDVLAGLPGVRSSFFGPGASRPVIRGLSGPRVMVLTNRVGMIDASGLSPDHQVASDPQEAERIELLRGPAALAYGGSAIGGVVNIIDGRIADSYQAGVHGRALASYSSGDEGRQVSGALQAGANDRWMVSLDGVHRATKDYGAPTGKVANSHVTLDAFGAGVSYVADGGWGGVAIKRTETDYGSPAEADVTIALKQTRVDARGGLDLAAGPFASLKWTGGWADYEHTEFEGAEAGTTFLSKGFEGRLELVQRERDGWQGAFGVQGLSRDFDVIGEEALIPKTKITEAGVFTLQRLDRESWGVEGGLRLDRRKLDSVAGERTFHNVSASVAGFVRPADGWFLALAAARASRAPTEEELFSDGPHPATGAYEVGDAALGKEVSYSLDATAHYSNDRWSFDLHGFAARYDNFIDLVPTGVVDADSGFQVFRFVEGGARFRGAEAEVSYAAWRDGDRSLTLEASGDVVRGTTDNGPAARTPPYAATVRAVFEAPRWTGTLEARRVGEQDRLAPGETSTDGYTQVNVSLVLRPWGEELKIFLDARNLTDALAREHASFLKDVAPLPGRSVRVGLGYRF